MFIFFRHQLLINSFIMLIFMGLSSCTSQKTYTIKKDGTDYILDGCVQKVELQDPKKFPWFYYGYKAYQPDSSTMTRLLPHAKSMRVICFAGTWCSDTQRELPRLMRILDRLGVPENHYQLFMVNRQKKSNYLNPDVWNLEKVPTFIFYKEGKEIGRFIEESPSFLEKLMLTWYESEH